MNTPNYHTLMLQAVELSRNGFGRAAPNPCVGALLLRGGEVVAQGWHTACGQAHAEREALAAARAKGVDPSSCVMLVTLEPCNHHGKTPPCTEAILEAGIKHVIIGALDPNPVAAGGADRLRQAGVLVETGIAEQECLDNIADFILFKRAARAYLTLKLAATLDGRIATRGGHSQWISGPEALARVHWLRSRVQAVMVGGNTLYEDDPLLTARPEQFGAAAVVPSASSMPAGGGVCGKMEQPLAVAVTTRLPENNSPLRLLRERASSTIFFTNHAEASGAKAEALRRRGAVVYGLDANASGLDLNEALTILRSRHNCWHVLCEGGGRLGLSLLQSGLADEFDLHLAPKILADNQARPLFDGLSPQHMGEALRLRLAGSRRLGDDLCLKFMPLLPK